ncbi:MAG: cytochrome c-type biogenesis protein CcmH [Actinobacteria bacterium]|nr:cytochrome c-type biogenesis protein CcmH [Actinomycetota bacterium]
MSRSSLNRAIKKWPSWLVLLVLVVVMLVIGIGRDSGPSTAEERIDAIARRMVCPTCDGESVYESRGSASQAIRQEIARQVAAGVATDDQIVTAIDDSYEADLRLVPDAEGLEAVIWIVPVVVAVIAVAGLVFVFRRWRDEGSLVPTDEERALVDEVLRNAESST